MIKRKKKCLIREYDSIIIVYDDFFDEIETRERALSIGISAYFSLHDFLRTDALLENDTYIDRMKVTTGFKRTLDELDKRFFFLTDEIRSVDRKNEEGMTVFRC